MFHVSSKGDFNKTFKALNSMIDGGIFKGLDHYGQVGVDALSSATPRDTGGTAGKWEYRIVSKKGLVFLQWWNFSTHSGKNIVLLIQYGHGTGTGGYVAGNDFINPTMRPIFDKVAEEVWRTVTNG